MTTSTMTITLTRAQLEKARTDLLDQGISIVGDSGEISHEGVTVDFIYVEPNFQYTIKHKPWEVTVSFVNNKIADWFKQEA